MAHRLAPLVVFVLTLAASASAQPSFSASFGQGLEALQPTAEAGETQNSLAGAGTVQYLFANERARVFYDLGISDYASPGDWRTMAHETGGRYRFDLGSGNRHRLFTGGSVVLRRNGDSWDAADYNAVGGFANLELRPTDTIVFRTGYRVDLRKFPTFAPLDQLEHSAFASALVNFQTRTTLIGEVAFGAKHYEGTAAFTAVVPVDSAVVPGSGASGWRGNGGMHGSAGQAGLMSSLMTETITLPGSSGTDARLVTVLVRAAQSLASRTGLSVELQRRETFGDVPPAVVATPARFFDDGVYDDPYASDSTLARASLKSIVWLDIELGAHVSWQDKPYGATPALDAEGHPIDGVLRHDRVVRAAARAAFPIAPARTGAFDVQLLCGYDFTRDRSTTAAYTYTSHAIGVGIQVGY
jgi:hypothetical protein